MRQQIKIIVENLTLTAELSDTPCALEVYNSLPIEASPQEWGDEFYFSSPLKSDLDDTATTKVEVGDIGYWPPGSAIAIFFGPTPMSSGDDPVPASEVNIIGKITGDATLLRQTKGAAKIRIEKAED